VKLPKLGVFKKERYGTVSTRQVRGIQYRYLVNTYENKLILF
jgi:hypothetical protein